LPPISDRFLLNRLSSSAFLKKGESLGNLASQSSGRLHRSPTKATLMVCRTIGIIDPIVTFDQDRIMLANRTQDEVLGREYLPVRAKILEIAAALDRIERARAVGAEGSAAEGQSDPRLEQLRQALPILQQPGTDHAEQVLQHFSLEYDDSWMQQFGIQG